MDFLDEIDKKNPKRIYFYWDFAHSEIKMLLYLIVILLFMQTFSNQSINFH